MHKLPSKKHLVTFFIALLVIMLTPLLLTQAVNPNWFDPGASAQYKPNTTILISDQSER